MIHPQALVESDSVGTGTRVWAFAHVMKGAVIGRDCNVGGHCFIESDAKLGNQVTVKNGVSIWSGVEIGDEVFVGPGVTFTNVRFPRAFIKRDRSEYETTRIERGATLGAGAVLVCGISVGEYSFIGAGTVVNQDVPPHALVHNQGGSTGKVVGYVCKCGKSRVKPDAKLLDCKACGTSRPLC